MSRSPQLVLDPRRCDRCGRCLAVCDANAIRVGRTYLAVDWARCNDCGACVRACTRGAIVARGSAAPQPRAAKTGGKPAAKSAGAARGRQDARTPRSRSAAAKTARPPKSGARGGFQWTLLEAAAMLSVTFSAFVVKEAMLASSGIRALPPQIAIAGQVGVLGLYYAIQIVVLGWLVRRRGGELLAAVGLRGGGGFARAAASGGLVLAGLLGTRVVASLYVYFTRQVGLMPTPGTNLLTLFGSDYTGLVLAMLMVVLIGPFVEEVVFRAALLEGLAARLGAWPAIFAQAALFAAFHRSLWLFFPMFVLGAALGWLAHARGSLWPAVAMHALYNGITVAAAFYVALNA
jgi:membrane protease YdiL (CAAX protease family)/NAD-dependent dihydropyrimidine dehydrogenase PreA subunit